MQLVEYTLPDYWAAYLFNDDPTNLTDEEHAAIDHWLDVRKLNAPLDLTPFGFTSTHDAWQIDLACECSVYTFVQPEL